MLELAPDLSFAVLSPAFKGNEGCFALNAFAGNGCTFFSRGLCELFGRNFQPLECRFCRHDRTGLGSKCHDDIAKEWDTGKGKRLVRRWLDIIGLDFPDRSAIPSAETKIRSIQAVSLPAYRS